MYVFSTDLPDANSHIYDTRFREQWEAYRHELERIANKLRPATREFALAEWHYTPSDPRCPHDAWLETATVREVVSDENPQHRHPQIIVRLLGAYHDGHIELTYDGVIGYCLDFPPLDRRRQPNRGHGDWLVDEIRFTERGKVFHEIEWSNGARWYIECDDVCYRWLPDGDLTAP